MAKLRIAYDTAAMYVLRQHETRFSWVNGLRISNRPKSVLNPRERGTGTQAMICCEAVSIWPRDVGGSHE